MPSDLTAVSDDTIAQPKALSQRAEHSYRGGLKERLEVAPISL
jgi:hypothetical protein